MQKDNAGRCLCCLAFTLLPGKEADTKLLKIVIADGEKLMFQVVCRNGLLFVQSVIPSWNSEQSFLRCLNSFVTISLMMRLSQSSSIELQLLQPTQIIGIPRHIYYKTNPLQYTLNFIIMVKIATITHQPATSAQHTPNADHPFSRAREFQRAFNATKLQRIFAKPFVAAMQGHSDGLTVLSKCPLALNKMLSGAHDGQIRLWDLSQRKTVLSLYDHKDSIKGVSFSRDGRSFLSSSVDKSIHLYNFANMMEHQQTEQHISGDFRIGKSKGPPQPVTKYLSKHVLGNVDHSPGEEQFATSGQVVQVWSYERTKPIYQLQWNVDSILSVKYNPADSNLLCGTCIDRSVILYDLRGQTAVQKITLPNKSMCLSWNPLEPINLVVGNDDSNCYSFDIRKMDRARTIHKGHIGAVMDIDFASSGREFATGSFDRTLRIFGHDSPTSREVYHAKRMQIVTCVQFTADSHYLLSGSEDMNLRLWKAVPWQPTGVTSTREERAALYKQKLIEKYSHSNKIRRIANHRHLPKYIVNASQRKQEQTQSRNRKKINKQANTGVVEEGRREKKKLIENIGVEEEKEEWRPKKQEEEGEHPEK